MYDGEAPDQKNKSFDPVSIESEHGYCRDQYKTRPNHRDESAQSRDGCPQDGTYDSQDPKSYACQSTLQHRDSKRAVHNGPEGFLDSDQQPPRLIDPQWEQHVGSTHQA